MMDGALAGTGNRKDVVWQEPTVAASYLEVSREAIPLEAEQLDAMIRVIQAFGCPTGTVLDIGAGDGAVSAVLAERFDVDSITLVDFSRPMLREAMARFARWSGAVAVIEGDLFDSRWLDELPGDDGAYDIVVSRYAIHHLPDSRKQELYAEIHTLLKPGGLFINIEHVKPASPIYTDMFNSLMMESMAAAAAPGYDPAAMAEPYYERKDAQANILAPADVQCRWLRDIGFVDVDVVMKVFELAVIVARRPE